MSGQEYKRPLIDRVWFYDGWDTIIGALGALLVVALVVYWGAGMWDATTSRQHLWYVAACVGFGIAGLAGSLIRDEERPWKCVVDGLAVALITAVMIPAAALGIGLAFPF